MNKDAKLGLVIGIGLVIVIAVVFFRKDPASAKAASETTAAAVKPKVGMAATNTPTLSDVRPVPGATAKTGRHHTVVVGDTLYGLAGHYYHDRTRFIDIYQANRDMLTSPEPLTPGTVLFIPEAGQP